MKHKSTTRNPESRFSKKYLTKGYTTNIICIYIAYHETFSRVSIEQQNNMTKKQRKKPGKKDSQLVIRINGEERDAFVSLCEELDTSAAREIRKCIRQFMAEHKTVI